MMYRSAPTTVRQSLCLALVLLFCRSAAAPAAATPIRVVDDTGQPVVSFELMIQTNDYAFAAWETGRDGVATSNDIALRNRVRAFDIVVRAEGFASKVASFVGDEREAVFRGEGQVKLEQGALVELQIRLPDGLDWPAGALPDVFTAEYASRVKSNWVPGNGVDDFNILNVQPKGSGAFTFRLGSDVRQFSVGVNIPGRLRLYEFGPFTRADVADGVLQIEVPRPATLQLRFAPEPPVAELPFAEAFYDVMRMTGLGTAFIVESRTKLSLGETILVAGLAPGVYRAEVRTQPKPGVANIARSDEHFGELNPGMFVNRQDVDLPAGETRFAELAYQPFDPNAFRGSRTAKLRIVSPAGAATANRRVAVGYWDGHYGELEVFVGELPESGELPLAKITDRVPTTFNEGPYTVRINGEHLGFFRFASDAPTEEIVMHVTPGVGHQAPDIKLFQMATNKTIKLSDLRGKIVCLEFWATWCGPCKSAIASLDDLAAKHAADGQDQVAFVALSVDDRADQVPPYASGHSLRHLDFYWAPRGDDARQLSAAERAFVVLGIPKSLVIDRQGRILWRGHPERDHQNGKTMEDLIDAAVRSPAQSRE
ncbi:MAG: TlpA family protein disulfide reductase [Pirellulales bacterium]|nr:TlpA family protein disulfide reductase [Pirellulales bacterium]